MAMRLNPELLRVVLVETSNPLNIGAAARAMSNFGFLHLRVVNPYDVAFREARSAMAAAPVLANAQEFTALADAVADCTMVVGTTAIGHRELLHPLRGLDEAAALIRNETVHGPVALVFGAERTGLSNEDLSHCHWLLHIPTREQHLSMNLGQAVAVCLYELARDVGTEAANDAQNSQRNAKANSTVEVEEGERASAAEEERISQVLLEALRISGYVNPTTVVTTEDKVRRLVRRMNVSSTDAEVWTGMLRQILWKIKKGE